MRLVYLSPVTWGSYQQRPHEMISFFHKRTGGEVLWIDPYPTRLPTLKDISNSRHSACPAHNEIPAWLTVHKPCALPIEPLKGIRHANRLLWGKLTEHVRQFAQVKTIIGIGKPSLLGRHLLAHVKFQSSFYDVMDDFSAFYRGLSAHAMAQTEQHILSKVDNVLASSTTLYSRLKQEGYEHTLMIKNGCASERLPEASDLNRAILPPYVIGYVGTIADWFDWDLIITMAHALPDAKIKLIGPVYDIIPAALPRNVEMHLACSHEKAIQMMKTFHMGIIPFKKIPLTAYVDPIKYYEYRALGLPVLSSNFGEMSIRVNKPGVWLVNNQTNFQQCIKQACEYRDNSEAIAQFRVKNSWNTRFTEANLFS